MRAILLALLLAGCATQPPVVESAPVQSPGEAPVVRLIGLATHVEQIKNDLATLRKEKRLTPPQAAQIDMLVKLATAALESARNSYFVGDFDSFERSMSAVDVILQEFRIQVASFESERKMSKAERAYSRSQKPKGAPK